MSEQPQLESGSKPSTDIERRTGIQALSVPEGRKQSIMDIFRAAQRLGTVSRVDQNPEGSDSPMASKELVPVGSRVDAPEERFKLVVGGVTEKAERQSILTSAEKAFDRGSAEKGGKIRRFLRNIVRHDIGREFLMLRERSKAKDTIQGSHRLYDMSEEEWQNLSASSIQRVLDDRQVGEMMDVNAGEQQKVLETNEGQVLRTTIDRLVTDYVENYEGKYNTEEGKQSLQQEMRRQIAELAKDNPEMQGLLGAGEAYMSNIVEIAEQVRQRVDHEHGIDEVLKKVDIITARLDPGARTVLQETKTTKAFDALAKFGGLNGTIIASAAAIGYGIAVVGGKAGLQYGAKVGLGVPILGSAIAGVISGFQEKARLAHERTQVQREEELGYTGAKGTKRREELKNLLNNMSNATVLTEALRQHKKGEEGHEAYEVTEDNFDQLLLTAVGASARRDLSSEKERAFVAYSGETEAENAAERRELFLETVRARSALRKHYESQGQEAKNGVSFDEFYEARKTSIQESLLREASNKDEQYSEYSTKRALIKGAMTAGAGLLIGAGVSEGAAWASEKIKGIGEAIVNTNFGAQAKTLLAYTFDHIKAQFNGVGIDVEPIAPPNFTNKGLPGGGNLHLDDRLSFSDTGSTVTVDGPNGLHIEGLQKDSNGTLTEASQQRLKAANIEYAESKRNIKVPGGDVMHQKVNDYAHEHGTRVDRSWWDNDTDRTYEGNPYLEQSLRLSKDSNGNIIYSMKINEDALAFHGSEKANLKNGTFKMALSLTKESQSTPIMVDMHRHGDEIRAVFKPKNPLYSIFETHEGSNNVDLEGRYGEAVQVMGDKDHDGRLDIRSLATDTGPGSVKTIDVPVDSTKSVHDMSIYLKQPAAPTRPFVNFTDSGAPMTLFVYPPYRTGLREADNRDEQANTADSPEPTPPANPDGPSTELEVRPRSSETFGTPVLSADQSSGSDSKPDNKDNVRNVDFKDKASNFDGDARVRWEEKRAEQEKWQQETARLRAEAEARAKAAEEQARAKRAQAEQEQKKDDAPAPPQTDTNIGDQKVAEQSEKNSQPSGPPTKPPIKRPAPVRSNETPEQRKRRIDQEEGIAARNNGAPIPQELHNTNAYRTALQDYLNIKSLYDHAKNDMAKEAMEGIDDPVRSRELQKRINLTHGRFLEAKRKLSAVNNGRDKEANDEVFAIRRRQKTASSPKSEAAA